MPQNKGQGSGQNSGQMKGSSASIQRRRRDLWLLRAVALVITLLLWVTVLGGKKVEMTKRVSLDYQVPKNFVIANAVPQEVTFRVSGPRAFLKEFQERPITIPINLRSAEEGDYEVTIREDMLEIPLGLKVSSISQSNIPVKLDRMGTKRVPVRAVFKEGATDIKVRAVTLDPSTVELLGPRARLKNVESVPTEPIAILPETPNETTTVKLNLVDLPGVRLAESDSQVQVSLDTEGASQPRKWLKDLPIGVRLATTGSHREGQRVDVAARGLRIRPATVNFHLEGPKGRLDALGETDVEVWAEIVDLKPGSHRARLVWTLPPDIRIVRRSADWVEVVVPATAP